MRRALATLVSLLAASAAFARDSGQWRYETAAIRAWYENLKQPDNGLSCCGAADAYYADKYRVDHGKLIATVTDSRGNPIPVGTQVIVPPNKVNRDPNLIGHVVIFLGGDPSDPTVYCYVPATGV
jgi:hypothetical protein